MKHSLALATEAAKRRLHRAESVLVAFSAVLNQDPSSTTSAPLIPTTLPLATRKLLTDSAELVSSLQALRSVDPLGASLSVDDRREGVLATSSSAADKPSASSSSTSTREKAWKGDRDKYVAWEANQIIAGAKAKQREREKGIITAAAAGIKEAGGEDGKARQTTGTPRSNKRGHAIIEGSGASTASKRKSAR